MNLCYFFKRLCFMLLLFMNGKQILAQPSDSLVRVISSQYSLEELDSVYKIETEKQNLDMMLSYALAMLEEGQEQLDIRDTAFARILVKVAGAYIKQMNLDKAYFYINQAINIQKIKVPNHYDYARSLKMLGAIFFYQGKYKHAEKLWVQVESFFKKKNEKNNPDYAMILNNLGGLYWTLGENERALSYYLESESIRKQVLGTEHPDYAMTLFNLGNLYVSLAKYEQALVYYKQALKVYSITVGKEHTTYAEVLNGMGGVCYWLGDYDYALSLLYKAKDIREKKLGKMHPYYASSLTNIGSIYDEIGYYEKALQFYIEAMGIQDIVLGKKHSDYLTNLDNLGITYSNLGYYEKALSIHIQTATIREKILGDKHPSYAMSLNNIGAVYDETRNYKKALAYYEIALIIEEEVLGKMHTDYARTLYNIGRMYRHNKNYVKSEESYRQAMLIREELFGKKSIAYAIALNGVGVLYQDMYRYESALKIYIEVMNIRGEILEKSHPEYIVSLNNIGNVYIGIKNYRNAWKYLLSAIKSNTNLVMSHYINDSWKDSLVNANYVSIAKMNKTLIHIYDLLEAENFKKTQEHQAIICDLALALLERSKDDFSGEDDKLRILAESSDWVQRSMRVLDKTKNAEQAFAIMEQNKSVLLLEAAANKRVYSFGLLPDSLVRQEKQLQKEYTNLKANLSKKLPIDKLDSLQVAFSQLNFQIDDFKTLLQDKYPKYWKLKYQHSTINVKAIQKSLNAQEALIEYLVGDSILYIFYIDANNFRIEELKIKKKQLEKHADSLHQVLSDYFLLSINPDSSYQIYKRHAYWFYQHIVAPILKKTDEIKHLVIITDGVLGHLPFETFLTESAKKGTDYRELPYLMNDYIISYNYAATLWQDNQRANKDANHNNKILAMAANYDIALDSVMRNVRLPTYQDMRSLLTRLPEARKEVKMLQDDFEGYFAFDELASEQNFKDKATSFAIIHLAMHGQLNKGEQLLSSLVFTENSDSNQNNFLQAYEVSKMELNAKLVVLSACETGYGEFEQGNGMASLARAFMYAGVPAIVVSLWNVQDEATTEIMQYFYQNLSEGMTKSQALRQAKLDYIKEAEGIKAHPAFWSAFIQLGNDAPIEIARKPFLPWRGWGISIVVLLAGLLFRKKLGLGQA